MLRDNDIFFSLFLIFSLSPSFTAVDRILLLCPGSLCHVDKESETAADVTSRGRVDAKQASPYMCQSGYYLRSCVEILRLSWIMSKIFNQTANESFLSKLMNFIDPVFRYYLFRDNSLRMARGLLTCYKN